MTTLPLSAGRPVSPAGPNWGFLLKEMVKRDFRSRYAGSFFGLLWSLLQPLWQLVLFTFVFSLVLKIPLVSARTDSFPVFLLAALIPWSAIQEGLTRSTTAIVDNATLVKKLNFPPQLLVLSTVISGLFQSGLAASVFVLYLLWQGELSFRSLPWLLLALPLQIMLTVGLGLGLAATQVFFRDTVQLVNIATTTWFYLTPIVYSWAAIPDHFLRRFIELNPLTGLVSIYRQAFLGGSFEEVLPTLILGGVALLALLLGVRLFSILQPGFADEV